MGHCSVLLAEIDHENEHHRRIALAILQGKDEYLDSTARKNRLDPMSIIVSCVSLDSIEIYACFMFQVWEFLLCELEIFHCYLV